MAEKIVYSLFIKIGNINIIYKGVWIRYSFVWGGKTASAVQVNGHLDYMRQMDTILVAVGIPTKEFPGASFALPRPVTLAEGTVEPRDRPPRENQETEPEEKEERRSCTEEDEDAKDVTGDGWDIPDISDLLDSLNDVEPASQTASRSSLRENAADENPASALNGTGDSSEGDDPEGGHVSWSWEDTNWTVEHTHKQKKQPNL